MRVHAIAVAGVGVLLAAACSETSGPDQNTLLNADVAVVAADAALEGVHMMRDPALGNGGPGDRARSVTCYDETGAEQEACDRLTTATMVVAVDVSHSVEREVWAASVERHSEMTMSGLLGENATRTINGGGTETVSRSHHSDEFGTRTYDMSGSFSYDNVVVPAPGSDSPWPVSGSIARTINVVIVNGRNGDQTVQRVVLITFNGTQFAQIDVNGEVAELDLATRPGRFFGPMHGKMRRGGGPGQRGGGPGGG